MQLIKEHNTAPTDDKPPAHNSPGWLLVEVLNSDDASFYLYEVNESAVDNTASTFWITEGIGVEFWLETFGPKNLSAGWWVFENVVGFCSHDDEEWYYDFVRPALPDEIATLYVTPCVQD